MCVCVCVPVIMTLVSAILLFQPNPGEVVSNLSTTSKTNMPPGRASTSVQGTSPACQRLRARPQNSHLPSIGGEVERRRAVEVRLRLFVRPS